MFETISATVAGFDVLDWWIIGFVVVGLFTGVVSGYFQARKIQKSGLKWQTIGHEVMWASINVIVSAFTLGTLKAYLTINGLILYYSDPVAWWVIAVQFTLYFFLFDTWFYWGHRLMHIEPIYTWKHKTHHISTKTNPLTSFSVNPIEGFLNGSFTPLFFVMGTLLTTRLLGLPPLHETTVALIAAHTVLMGLYVHSGFEFLPSWWNKTWLTKWLISATFHDQHHQYFIGNYGGYTTIWDRLCGTIRKNFERDFERITTRPIEPKWRRRGAETPAV